MVCTRAVSLLKQMHEILLVSAQLNVNICFLVAHMCGYQETCTVCKFLQSKEKNFYGLHDIF